MNVSTKLNVTAETFHSISYMSISIWQKSQWMARRQLEAQTSATPDRRTEARPGEEDGIWSTKLQKSFNNVQHLDTGHVCIVEIFPSGLKWWTNQ